MKRYVYIGWDPRECDAFAVARRTAERHLSAFHHVNSLVLSDLRRRGLYSRPTSRHDGRLWDDISDAPMSTEFAISRFLVPSLAPGGWALFMDADVMVRRNLGDLFALADPTKAVMVVKHDHRPERAVKMDGQAQQQYPRKNWSSVMLFNCDHPSNRALTTEMVNELPGRDLHRFCWLADDEIGALDPTWNWLVGYSEPLADPAIVHFTEGVPSMPGHEDNPFADEWRAELERWAA